MKQTIFLCLLIFASRIYGSADIICYGGKLSYQAQADKFGQVLIRQDDFLKKSQNLVNNYGQIDAYSSLVNNLHKQLASNYHYNQRHVQLQTIAQQGGLLPALYIRLHAEALNDPAYFVDKFKHMYAQDVFHYLQHYQDLGFRNYVKTLPGFDQFLDSMLEVFTHQPAYDQFLAQFDNPVQAQRCVQGLKSLAQERLYSQSKKMHVHACLELSARGFNAKGVNFLERYDATQAFLYRTNQAQQIQLQKITQHMNDTGDFWELYQHELDLVALADNAGLFGVMSNNANRENLPILSQTLLEVGENYLALGRGLVAGCERSLTNLGQMLRHPWDTTGKMVNLVHRIGTGIGSAALLVSRAHTAQLLNDELMLDQVQAQVDGYLNTGGQIYYELKNIYQDSSRIERYELVGNVMTDLLFAKYGGHFLNTLKQLKSVQALSHYKSVRLAKLGSTGREISQLVGMTCVKGVKAVKHGFEIVTNHPQVIQSQLLLGEAIATGHKCLVASNKYLKKLSNHALKCALDSERRLIRIGNKIKKIPKTCITKNKQILGDEVIVTDTFGNIWRAKINEAEWATELSAKGKRTLALLNEAGGGLQNTAREAFKAYRTVPLGVEERAALNLMKWQLRAVEKELQAACTTFKDFYGAKISGKLGDKLIHFKGKAHLLSATIKRTIKSSGVSERLTGMHWDFGRKLERLGVYSLSEVEELVGGMYRATLKYCGVVKDKKSFFPSHWDARMLTAKISEACCNATKIVTKRDGILEITGIVEEGFQIIVKIGKRGNIITAYPELVGKII